jgi:hypothetical protein
MPESVMILGGYGTFGKRIAMGLKARKLKVIIAGRDEAKAKDLAHNLNADYACFDIKTKLHDALSRFRPKIVIHTAGPFQGADYSVAQAVIQSGAHYIDLADGRAFVTGFKALEALAKANNVVAITGASTVPCLSSAVIEAVKSKFSEFDTLSFGICPGQGAERGIATTKAILSYVGKPLKPFAGHPRAYGWQGLRSHRFLGLGRRWLGDCDVPDLDLLPQKYGFKSIRFGAGLEVGLIHLGLWAMSWGVRFKLLPFELPQLTKPLLYIANGFDRFGSDDGGMFMAMSGKDLSGQDIKINWQIIAKGGDGPQIPAVPAILLAERLLKNDPALLSGAMSSLGLIDLKAYIEALQTYQINTSFSPLV